MKNGKVNLFNESTSTYILIFITTCFALGNIACEKVTSIFENKSLQSAIKKLSSDAQTSCVEGFHATLNFWHPKMLCFSWMGSYSRYLFYFHVKLYFVFKEKRFTSYSFTRIALAALHFNKNVRRSTATKRNGEPCKKISYPKHKLGEEIVRDIRIQPRYGKDLE